MYITVQASATKHWGCTLCQRELRQKLHLKRWEEVRNRREIAYSAENIGYEVIFCRVFIYWTFGASVWVCPCRFDGAADKFI